MVLFQNCPRKHWPPSNMASVTKNSNFIFDYLYLYCIILFSVKLSSYFDASIRTKSVQHVFRFFCWIFLKADLNRLRKLNLFWWTKTFYFETIYPSTTKSIGIFFCSCWIFELLSHGLLFVVCPRLLFFLLSELFRFTTSDLPFGIVNHFL